MDLNLWWGRRGLEKMSAKDHACHWTVGAMVQLAKLLGSCKTFHVIHTPLLVNFRFDVPVFRPRCKDKVGGCEAAKVNCLAPPDDWLQCFTK